jgi:hypothetical protein
MQINAISPMIKRHEGGACCLQRAGLNVGLELAHGRSYLSGKATTKVGPYAQFVKSVLGTTRSTSDRIFTPEGACPGYLMRLISFLLVCVAGVAAGAENSAPITPRETVVLFNGKDLTNFYTWEAKHGREDPDRVFTVVDQIDGAPAVRMSGQHYGGIVTTGRYANYRLVAEFRWGIVTWEPRKNRTRDAGILLHCQGEDGNYAKDFKAPWMRSVEYQFIEGGTGDVILVGGYERGQAEQIMPAVKATVTSGTKVWNPEGTLAEFGKGKNRVDWRHKDPQWKEVLGFRGPNDVEKPAGQWNRVEAICDDANITYLLNGVKVNELRDSTFKEGRILIQSEGAEVFFRRIELHPLQK